MMPLHHGDRGVLDLDCAAGVHRQCPRAHLEPMHGLGNRAKLVVADELGRGALADLVGVADVIAVAVAGDDEYRLL